MYDLHIDFFIQFTWDFVKIRCFAGIYRFIYSRVHNNTCFQHSIYLNFNHYKCTLLSNCPSNKSINIVKQGTVTCFTLFSYFSYTLSLRQQNKYRVYGSILTDKWYSVKLIQKSRKKPPMVVFLILPQEAFFSIAHFLRTCSLFYVVLRRNRSCVSVSRG